MSNQSSPFVLPLDDARHGSIIGYNWFRCRCEHCRRAFAAYMRRYNAAQRGTLAPGDPRHSRYGYNTFGCRCEVCKAANRVYRRGLRARPPDR